MVCDVIEELLATKDLDLTTLSAALDRLGETQRLSECLKLKRTDLARLFDISKEAELSDLCVAGPTETVCEGLNSLPAFRRFAKVFCQPRNGASADELWGYNRNSQVVEKAVGPGYFIATKTANDVVIDYTKLPPGKMPGWPPIIRNDRRLSRFVYSGTKDVVRKVSTHVTIGRAFKKGKALDAWFVLCRT